MDRRDFLTLGAKTSIIILGAPAIVKAENLMKIWVPPKTLVLPEHWQYSPQTGTLIYHGSTEGITALDLYHEGRIWAYVKGDPPPQRISWA